uniref:Pentatricopeptide repeat-containing protein n=1 Tax=Ananas comosus var. bracteatus TaxID=296719 RepID=A0A6V7PQA2_ANACO|nr:unnamed protein product [Ananas comosus var. bracteatus]
MQIDHLSLSHSELISPLILAPYVFDEMPLPVDKTPPPPPSPSSSSKTLTLDATLDLDLPSRIAELVLRHPHGDNARSLALALSNLSPRSPPPSPTPSSSASGTTPPAPSSSSAPSSTSPSPWPWRPRSLRLHLRPLPRPRARLRDRRRVHSLLLLRRRLLPRLAPSPRTFSLLAERLVLSGKPDRAVRLFLSSPSSLHTPRAFNSLLDALCKSRRVHKATSLFKTLKHRFPPDAATYNILAEGWCRLQRTSQALDLLRDMVASGVAPTKTTYNILLHGLFRARQTRQALDFFAQMKRRSKTDPVCAPDVVSYTTVLHGLGLSGELRRAREVLDEMPQRGVLPNVAAYNALIQVICKKGTVGDASWCSTKCSVEFDLALGFVDRMRRDRCGPIVQTHNIIMRCYFEEGEIEKGLEMFDKMGVRGACLPNLDTYNVIISAIFVRKRGEDMVVAGKMVREMVERGFLPRRFMFNKVVNGLLVTGNQEFARELLRLQDKCGRLRREIRI